MSHAGVVFGKTCYERHDHQCFDGAPCGRDQGVLVGAVDSCTQGRQGKRITVSSIQIHSEREVDINMHRYRRSTGALSKSACDVNIRTRRASQDFDACFFCVIHLSCFPYGRQECISPHPRLNPLFEVPSPSLQSLHCPSLPQSV